MVDELREVLEKVRAEVMGEMDGKEATHHLIRFNDTPTHFARLVLIDFDPGYPPQLFFGSNHDGTNDAYLDALIQAGPGLDDIWGKCQGYPEQGTQNPAAFKKFIRDHTLRNSAYYVCYPTITKESAKNALDVFDHIGDYLDQKRDQLAGLPTADIVARINQFVKDEPIEVMEGSLPKPSILFRFISRFQVMSPSLRKLLVILPPLVIIALCIILYITVPALKPLILVLAALAVIGIGVLGFLYRALRRQEELDTAEYHRTHTGNYIPSDIVLKEDARARGIAQSQMSLVNPIRPAWIHRLALKGYLVVLNYLSTNVATQGSLGDVRTVHFARWLPIDNGERLIFNSQFDESWQQYIGAFVDLLPGYLTAIWSNVLRYPPTKNLVQEGATYIEGFMQFIREFQIPSNVFFSAYSEVAAQNIVNAVQVREGLGKTMNTEEQEAWLRRFAGTISVVPQSPSSGPELGPTEAKVKDNLHDIQGWILSGYGRFPHATYLFLSISNAAQVRDWVRLVAEEATTAEEARAYRSNPANLSGLKPFNLAFTAGGLRKLGLPHDAMITFPMSFQQGIAHEYDEHADPKPSEKEPSQRSRQLGDTGTSAPEHWDVGGPEHLFDVLVILRERSEEDMGRYAQQQKERCAQYGLELVFEQEGHRVFKEIDIEVPNRAEPEKKAIFIEHFGFHDGISEPCLRDSGFEREGQPLVAAGDFLLGYKNQYDHLMPTPSVRHELDPEECLPRTSWPTTRKDFGRNGTYMAFRLLPQHVHRFWDYYQSQTNDEQEMIKLASRSVGRWPSGAPLTLTPDRDDTKYTAKQYINTFMYVQGDDMHGFKCPFASHIRRTNPRDSLSTHNSLTISDRHHIIRRGMTYGNAAQLPPWDGQMPEDDGEDRGLVFFALNTSLRRQFEFVQMAWSNSPRFNGLYDSKDPIIGPNDGKGDLSLEAQPYRDRYRDVPRFVDVKGGAYLFMPSISGLRFLARLPE
ncbi:MAG: hypothetical protein ETSY1_11795 [Candidatus Entotheonella factor]|uniref:Peroxidase n=1 Tax=Entotheonella factor TaxID=1429438 RepID=W4LRF6_ENTF1|nr:MAG: hypothetical protein ETSY1_11795 [Candidatus Entotheonella factor]